MDYPKDIEANLRFRELVYRLMREDDEFAGALWEKCRTDILFWINCFGWLYEVRRGSDESKLLPFVSWDYQDESILLIQANLQRPWDEMKDVVIDKASRDLGFSWLVLYVMFHSWLFGDMEEFGLVSRGKDEASSPQNRGSLMNKLGMIAAYMPDQFLGPHIDRPGSHERYGWTWKVSNASMVNHERKSLFQAYAPTGEVGRSDRKKAILFDEFHAFGVGDDRMAWSSAQHTTKCRIALSTLDPKSGAAGMFYEIITDARNGLSEAVYIRAHWSQHPTKRKGLYRVFRNRMVEDDPNNPVPEEYKARAREIWDKLSARGFKVENKLRSPYYDEECLRDGSTPYTIAAELDGDFEGTTATVFDHHWIDTLKSMHAEPPAYTGALEHKEGRQPEFKRGEGEWSIWCPLDGKGRPPRSQYGVGVDVAAGTAGRHSSYSVIVVFDAVTGEMVAMFRSNSTNQWKLAQLSVAACLWFFGAKLGPETAGPLGRQYSQEILRLNYSNLYRRKQPGKVYTKDTDHFGFSHTDGGTDSFSTLHRGIDSARCLIRSEIVYEELKQYVWDKKKIKHRSELREEDDEGVPHGDAAVATACGWVVVEDMGQLANVERSDEKPPPGWTDPFEKDYLTEVVEPDPYEDLVF